jgi:hypothetical protein
MRQTEFILGRGRLTVTEHERLNYLNEHISYEVIMLNYTFMRLMTFQPSTPENELERNAFLESFGVHAWNLVDVPVKEACGRMIETRRTTSRPLSPLSESPIERAPEANPWHNNAPKH